MPVCDILKNRRVYEEGFTTDRENSMSLTCLFCLIISGFQALKELGIEIDVYCASEIDEQAMQVGIDRLSS